MKSPILRFPSRVALLASSAAALLASCGSGPTVASCVPGDSHRCACADGSNGAQVCGSDGTYGECACAPTDAGVAPDAPGPTDAATEDGSTADAGGDAATPGTYALTVLPATASTTLGTETTFTVSVAPSHWSGHVDLAASGGPATWSVTVDPASLDVVDGVESLATLHVSMPSDGDAAPAPVGRPITVTATASSAVEMAAATLNVANEYVIDIPAGTGSGPHFGALAGTVLPLRVGTTLTFHRGEGGHEIHGDGTFVAHESSTGGSGDYSVTVMGPAGPGTDHVYCHAHGSGSGAFVVVGE